MPVCATVPSFPDIRASITTRMLLYRVKGSCQGIVSRDRVKGLSGRFTTSSPNRSRRSCIGNRFGPWRSAACLSGSSDRISAIPTHRRASLRAGQPEQDDAARRWPPPDRRGSAAGPIARQRTIAALSAAQVGFEAAELIDGGDGYAHAYWTSRSSKNGWGRWSSTKGLSMPARFARR
jgi:hypothetical protein